MKQKYIDRLKEICEKEGFKLEIPGEAYFSGKQAFTITKKDPWEGVEFAESLHDLDWGDGKFTKGKIYRVKNVCKITITLMFDDNNNPINASSNTFFQPSTETEYVEQLKKEAFERFGEIKDGDRFDCSFWGGDKPAEYTINANKWRYEKKHDMLTLDHFCLYNSGKWATKLPEKAKVIPDLYYDHLSHSEEHHVFAFEIKNLSHGYSVAEVSNFLAKQFEKYLNEKPESIRCKRCYKLSSLLLKGVCQECIKNNQVLL